MNSLSLQTWQVISHLGAASLMLPMLVLIAAGFWLSDQRAVVTTWLVMLFAGVVLVLATKILFIGWGWGIASLDFTGISGHTMLASAIIPVWMACFLSSFSRRYRAHGAILGLLCGALVGWSRVALGAHSLSEVVVGWILGAGISMVAFHAMAGRLKVPGLAVAAGALLFLSLNHATSAYLPTHKWEIQVALALSGSGKPHVRSELHMPSRIDSRSMTGIFTRAHPHSGNPPVPRS